MAVNSQLLVCLPIPAAKLSGVSGKNGEDSRKLQHLQRMLLHTRTHDPLRFLAFAPCDMPARTTPSVRLLSARSCQPGCAPGVLPNEVQLGGAHRPDVLDGRPHAGQPRQILRRACRGCAASSILGTAAPLLLGASLWLSDWLGMEAGQLAHQSEGHVLPAGGTGREAGAWLSAWMSSSAWSWRARACSSGVSLSVVLEVMETKRLV